jgi:hypothetical protein
MRAKKAMRAKKNLQTNAPPATPLTTQREPSEVTAAFNAVEALSSFKKAQVHREWSGIVQW